MPVRLQIFALRKKFEGRMSSAGGEAGGIQEMSRRLCMSRSVWHSLCSLWHGPGRYEAALAEPRCGNGWEEMFVCSSAGAQGVSAPTAPVLRCQGDLKA